MLSNYSWFMKWAVKNLPQDDLRRVRAIDNRFRQTAQRVGLFDEKPVSAKSMSSTASKLKISSYMGGPAKRDTSDSWWN